MDKVRERTGLYHEHQQGYLCAQHALNNLLQDSVFSADTLAVMARELDAEEKSVLNNAPRISENVDDTGFFNIQVLQRALATYGLELVPYNSRDKIAVQARGYPESIRAYICNLGAHWFAIRRFAGHYFNLNSFQYVPLIMPIQILKQYLNMIETNGYSVFIVSGELQSSLADIQLETNPIGRMEYQTLIKDLPKYIMDGQPIDDLNGFPTGENISAKIPSDVIEKFRKNPNDPQVQEMINSFLPDGMVVAGFDETTKCTCPHHHHHQQEKLIISRAPKCRIEENKSKNVSTTTTNKQESNLPTLNPHNFDQTNQFIGIPPSMSTSRLIERPTSESILPTAGRRNLPLSQLYQNQMLDQYDDSESSEIFGNTLVTTTIRSQLIIRGGTSLTPDGRTRQFLLLQQSSRLSNPLMSMPNDNLMRMIQDDDDGDEDEDEENKFALQIIKDSARLKAEGKSREDIHRYLEDAMYEKTLKKAIDASLKASESSAKRSLEQPKSNPSSVTIEETTKSQPEIIPLPSALVKTPDPITPPPVILSETSVDNSDVPSSPTNNTDSPLKTETKSDPSASLTVEELRQRRLQSSGGKNRSIVSSYVPSDDENDS